MHEPIETLHDLWVALDQSDTYYWMSDDPRVYERGRQHHDKTMAAALRLGPEGVALRKAFMEHLYWDGKGERPAKPQDPALCSQNP